MTANFVIFPIIIPSSSPEVTDEWMYTSTTPYAFMACIYRQLHLQRQIYTGTSSCIYRQLHLQRQIYTGTSSCIYRQLHLQRQIYTGTSSCPTKRKSNCTVNWPTVLTACEQAYTKRKSVQLIRSLCPRRKYQAGLL